jgi:hypothetical protein
MDTERSVNELWCGNHGLGDVCRFLLRALGNDERAARAEFSKFLRGELSHHLLDLSRRAILEDRREHGHSAEANLRRNVTATNQRRPVVDIRGRGRPVAAAHAVASGPVSEHVKVNNSTG